MSLNSLLKAGKLKRHKTSAREISDLFEVVQRDLKDASIKELSADRRFATAYNAALQLTTILMYSHGYRAVSSRQTGASAPFRADGRNEVFPPSQIEKNGGRYNRRNHIPAHGKAISFFGQPSDDTV